ncbi:hypothetical protein Tco_1127887, partial [Tanacetum coccineum]
METHADVIDSERSENSSSQNLSMPYDHTPPSIAVPQTFSSHKDRQIKSMAGEGDASSLLVTSSSNVIVASDDGISQEDPTHYANAVSGVPGPVCLKSRLCIAWQFAVGECTWELSQQECEQLR